jgi:hypothetical protein
MATYLFTFRPPTGYAPSADTFGAWSSWQLELGARLKDRAKATTSPRTPTCRGSFCAPQAATPVPTRTP